VYSNDARCLEPLQKSQRDAVGVGSV
jgi:hypothetical protein